MAITWGLILLLSGSVMALTWYLEQREAKWALSQDLGSLAISLATFCNSPGFNETTCVEGAARALANDRRHKAAIIRISDRNVVFSLPSDLDIAPLLVTESLLLPQRGIDWTLVKDPQGEPWALSLSSTGKNIYAVATGITGNRNNLSTGRNMLKTGMAITVSGILVATLGILALGRMTRNHLDILQKLTRQEGGPRESAFLLSGLKIKEFLSAGYGIALVIAAINELLETRGSIQDQDVKISETWWADEGGEGFWVKALLIQDAGNSFMLEESKTEKVWGIFAGRLKDSGNGEDQPVLVGSARRLFSSGALMAEKDPKTIYEEISSLFPMETAFVSIFQRGSLPALHIQGQDLVRKDDGSLLFALSQEPEAAGMILETFNNTDKKSGFLVDRALEVAPSLKDGAVIVAMEPLRAPGARRP